MKEYCINNHLLEITRKRKPCGQSYCCECNKQRTDRNRLERPDNWALYQKRTNLKRYYGISVEEYDRLLSQQEGRCYICRNLPKRRKLAVDHDHTTNQIRGLLCSTCNIGLGNFKDNPELLLNAISYLNRK